MPVEWDQLEKVYPTDFTLRTVPDILEEQGDPWAGILTAKQDLGKLLEQRSAG
jgi:DNA primase